MAESGPIRVMAEVIRDGKVVDTGTVEMGGDIPFRLQPETFKSDRPEKAKE